MNTTSISLLERLRRPGEQTAWVRFVELYTPLLYHWGRQLGLAPEDVADLVQDVFTALVQKLPEFTYQSGERFRGWLHTVVRNRWRDRCRRSAARVVTAGPLVDVETPDPTTAFAEAEYRQHLVQQALRLIKAEFEPITWQACREYLVNGRPAAEVARELGITTNAVYLAKVRVLARLRQDLDGLLDVLRGGWPRHPVGGGHRHQAPRVAAAWPRPRDRLRRRRQAPGHRQCQRHRLHPAAGNTSTVGSEMRNQESELVKKWGLAPANLA